MSEVIYISGPFAKDLSEFCYVLQYHESPVNVWNKIRDSDKGFGLLFAAELLCNWWFWKQPNDCSYKKCITSPLLIIKAMDGFYFGRISGPWIWATSKGQCPYLQIWFSETGDSLFL